MPEPAKSEHFGFFRTLAAMSLSIGGGLLIGFILESTLTTFDLLKQRLGFVMLAVAACLLLSRLWRVMGFTEAFDVKSISRSAIPVWRHPAIWSSALLLSSVKLARDSHFELSADKYAAKWFVLHLTVAYVVVLVTYWLLSPAKWEREA